MTFDPFAPVPENDKPKERNIYDDILKSDAPVEPKKPFDPNFAPPPTTAPARPVNQVPVSRPVQPVLPPQAARPVAQNQPTPNPTAQPVAPVDAVEQTRRARVAADRQRTVAERGSNPILRELVVDEGKKKFPALVVAIVVTALLVIGGIGFGIYYALTNKSDVTTQTETALTTTGIVGLPEGFTGQQILDAPRLGDAEVGVDSQASELAAQLDFLDLEKTEGVSIPMQDANGKDISVYSAGSDMYVSLGKVSNENKQKIIDVANEYLVAQGYTPYDVNSSGADDPLDQPQIFVGGVRTVEDGSLESYTILINTADNKAVTESGVYITFYSSPHIKEGTEGEFTKFVTDSYNASR